MELQIPYKTATLLYGPPGTGKTMFARYIAFKKALPFCYLNFSRIIDSYMGSTAKNIAKAFAYASSNPCIFMLDEVDTISCDEASTPMWCIAPMDVVSKPEHSSGNTISERCHRCL